MIELDVLDKRQLKRMYLRLKYFQNGKNRNSKAD